ncbi:ribonuclease Z [Solitalea longa]|uniref:Ribonuclease Z n=1 Tax=Solitalea longa TaxID=2079460 RepID=A0A2S5A4Y8_9SPHI|nr:ribonuclease Z [Solitalea longa]POY37382.1 ribonuclease Z [Solitalea longa]
MTKFEVTILGSSSATPAHHRYPSAQIVNYNQKYYMIDCGEGAQFQLSRYGFGYNKIDYIFISHLHGDHYLGLVGLISSMHLNGRVNELFIAGPPELLEIIEIQLKYSQTVLRYPLKFVPTQTDHSEVIFRNSEFEVETIILDHRIPCTGFLFKELPRSRRIIKEYIKQFNIPPDYIPLIKAGADYTLPDGEVLPNAVLTVEPPLPRSYAYCSDTIMNTEIVDQIRGVDLLYHEATFLHDLQQRAADTFHTTARQAGEIATMANAKKLIIGHFSARYRDLLPHLEECQAFFKNSFLAKEGFTFEVGEQ